MAPAQLVRRLPSLIAAGTLALSFAASAQEAPRGFALPDVAAIVATWPFTDRAFRTGGGEGGNGAQEATVKALADEIAYSARFLPRTPAPQITLDAAERPPPDTTLWPEAIAADVFARPASLNDAGQWNLSARSDAALHQANRSSLPALHGAIERTAPADVALVWPDQDIVIRTAGRAVISALEARLRQRNEREQCSEAWCGVLDAVEKKAAADAATAPVEDAVANFFFEAAVGGTYTPTTRQQRSERSARATERAGLGFTPVVTTTVAGGTLPWEMRLLLGAVVADLRELESPVPAWPVRLSPAALNSLRAQRGSLGGFDLAGVSVTRYGVVSAGTSAVFEFSGALTFVDSVARRASYSVILRFSFEGDGIVVAAADVAPIAPERPTVHMAFVAATELGRLNRGAGLGPALLRSIAAAADRRGTGVPAEYYAFAIVLDRASSEARVGLRTALEPAGVAGYPGMPTVLDFDGWRVLIERATFALAAHPAFHFKTIYQAAADASPVLLGATSTLLGAAGAGTLAPVSVHTSPSAAFPNRVRP